MAPGKHAQVVFQPRLGRTEKKKKSEEGLFVAPGEHAQVVFQPRPRRNKPNIKKIKNQKKASSAGRFETKFTMEYYRHK